MVVVIVLSLIAAIIGPRIYGMKEAREYRDFRLSVRRIAQEARERSISENQPMSLSWDDSSQVFAIVVQDESGESVARIRTLQAPRDVTATQFTQAGQQTTSAEWNLRFNPDGRSEGGGIQFESGADVFHVSVKRTGVVQFGEGELPLTTEEKWEAGEYERRL